ncbi:hypothetical protein DR950_28915 [Kitasatospora xanthocidica]|uniref:Uncharacterized protein n=1 Tax=Kitasatospora xanthocidica TaxID=83382 RepID=A0A372ZZM1_9ACTN|nr:hypothetical protein DR950_28915 [Kitasatospora xanthocidica]
MPVLAWPMTSWPVSATGRVISWMGKGWTMPTDSSASAVSGRIPRSRKVVLMGSAVVDRVLPLPFSKGPRASGGRAAARLSTGLDGPGTAARTHNRAGPCGRPVRAARCGARRRRRRGGFP